MRKRLLFILCALLAFAGIAYAQSKTVTNTDLAKFREKRLLAEKDLRENYAKVGFPSPEELEKQIAKDAKEREELSARLTRERVERERRETEQRWLAYQAAQAAQAAQTQILIEDGGGYSPDSRISGIEIEIGEDSFLAETRSAGGPQAAK